MTAVDGTEVSGDDPLRVEDAVVGVTGVSVGGVPVSPLEGEA